MVKGIRVRQCIECGKLFIPSNPHNCTHTCSVICRKQRRRRFMRDYMRKRRKELGNPIKNVNRPLSNLTLVTVNGEQRVKGTVLLKSLIERGKVNGIRNR